jgi:hypothetical protein
MPTRSDFEAAAEKFQSAAIQVGDLAAAAKGSGAAQILRGGSLGRQVPDRIAAAASTAQACEGLIEEAVQTCLERAAIIAEYEIRVDIYDIAHAHYTRASQSWSAQYNAWWVDETGEVAQPGNPPRPPNKPTPPPNWADVRRL